jgi:phosphoesterase RecJ-like protein
LQAKKDHIEKAHQILTFINSHDNFLVSAHVNADGDAIASVIAVGLLMDQLNKKYYMILHDQEIDRRFDYLKGFNQIIHFNEKLDLQIESALILDVPGVHRLGDVAGLLPDKSHIAKIDHHPPEDDFAMVNFADEHASSTTQLIYEILETAGISVDIDFARAIYTGIVYDTGRFSFSNTTARDMIIGGRMIDLGVDPAEINNRIFFENSFSALRTIGIGLANMESYLDGAVNIIYLDYEKMNTDHQGEIEELANYSVAIRGGQVGLFIREIKPLFHKISLRSKGKVDVNQVAKAFDGGGHTHAAGCRIEGTKDQVIKMILDELKKHLID